MEKLQILHDIEGIASVTPGFLARLNAQFVEIQDPLVGSQEISSTMGSLGC